MDKFSNTELPSNKSFGIFFTGIFFLLAAYTFVTGYPKFAYILTFASLFLCFVTLTKADLLQPFNRLWMRFGLLLAMVVSPLVLGVIFFGMLTPMGLAMKLAGRDELCIKIKAAESNWKSRSSQTQDCNFKQQF